jgi:hypothetical protein
MKQRMAQRTGRPVPNAAPQEIRGASVDQLRQLAEHKERLQAQQQAAQRAREQQQREDRARQIYNDLMDAKRRCNESSSLSFDQFNRSLSQQRQHLQQTRGTDNIDFKVVVKDGRAYVKPKIEKP